MLQSQKLVEITFLTAYPTGFDSYQITVHLFSKPILPNLRFMKKKSLAPWSPCGGLQKEQRLHLHHLMTLELTK